MFPPGGPDTDSSEESGGDAALGVEGPTECDCEPGEPGFAGFAGPKVQTDVITSFSLYYQQKYSGHPADGDEKSNLQL